MSSMRPSLQSTATRDTSRTTSRLYMRLTTTTAGAARPTSLASRFPKGHSMFSASATSSTLVSSTASPSVVLPCPSTWTRNNSTSTASSSPSRSMRSVAGTAATPLIWMRHPHRSGPCHLLTRIRLRHDPCQSAPCQCTPRDHPCTCEPICIGCTHPQIGSRTGHACACRSHRGCCRSFLRTCTHTPELRAEAKVALEYLFEYKCLDVYLPLLEDSSPQTSLHIAQCIGSAVRNDAHRTSIIQWLSPNERHRDIRRRRGWEKHDVVMQSDNKRI
ncbi:hypothetical protein SCLCIDRAFT_290259 [Scleroderma citrinum Foug A]|uniref:Uncharacterized protein n=1 Tax=Scleroderma citrinum Foug A TaxID=1036808 RepID=A0A0C2ZSY9_9AGAM|nr:hypothetical protein SCLCIDRAFT_290259 [Scleroderma citrinum Foug A]